MYYLVPTYRACLHMAGRPPVLHKYSYEYYTGFSMSRLSCTGLCYLLAFVTGLLVDSLPMNSYCTSSTIGAYLYTLELP